MSNRPTRVRILVGAGVLLVAAIPLAIVLDRFPLHIGTPLFRLEHGTEAVRRRAASDLLLPRTGHTDFAAILEALERGLLDRTFPTNRANAHRLLQAFAPDRPPPPGLTGAPPTDAAVRVLTDALADGHPDVRIAAAATLVHYGPAAAGAVDALATMLAHRSTQDVAAIALASIGEPAGRALDALREIDEADAPGWAGYAIDAIERPGQARPIRFLPLLLERARHRSALGTGFDPEDAAREIQTMASTGVIGPANAAFVPELIETLAQAPLLTPGQVQPQSAVAMALGAIGPAAAAAVPQLVANLNNDGVGPVCAQALGQVMPEAAPAVPTLLQKLPEYEQPVRASVATLLADLASPDPVVRAAAAFALGGAGSPAASGIPELRKALVDDDELVRRAAEIALPLVDVQESGG